MKALMPALLALVGLGVGVGAGLALKPAPEAEEMACAAPAEAAPPADPEAEAPCPEADPFSPEARAKKKPAGELAYVPMEKPFVVPVFENEKIIAMVVVSVSVEAEEKAIQSIEAVKPRLRDSFLKAMFRHANSGGFNGSFTSGPKMTDLKLALLSAARGVLEQVPVEDVLITEIARQDS